MSIHDLEALYGDMLAGSMSAAIKWMRHPQVCVSLPKEVVDLIELEISARNDEIASLKDQNGQLRSALRRVADYVGGSVSDSASHIFHVMVADEVSFAFAALKKELDNLRQQLTNMTYSNASHRETAEAWRAAAAERDALKKELANEKDAHELCHGLRLVLANELEIARGENMALKKIERQRWERTNQTFGTNYSTEKANLMNLPMNPNDMGGGWSSLGMRRSGDF